MIKQLLATVAVAAMAFGASAEKTVLWTAEAPTGDPIAGWHDFLTMSAEEAAVLNTGDIMYVTITAKGTDGWPQVALFEGGVGWPPMTNAGAGDVPNTVSMSITADIAETIHKSGLTIKGESVYVSEISYEKSTLELTPNTVWFGPKQCGWGDPAVVAKEVFADVKAGDVIKVSYDVNSEGLNFNFLFGGWGCCGINFNEADKTGFITVDRETGWAVITLPESASKFEWTADGATNEYDLFQLLKDGGLYLQGPCIFNQAQYFPASDDPSAVNAIESESAAEYYNLQGVKVVNPAKGQIYIVKKGAKTVKAAF